MSSATTTIASQALTAALGGVSTEVMTVDQVLSAGTYYLILNVPGYFGTTVTPGDVDGWLLSNGLYDNAAGTITNGVGSFVGSNFVINSSNPAPAFTVNGTPVSAVPEPPGFVFLSTMLVIMAVLYRGKRRRNGLPSGS
jgi:hypothetical protein